MIFFALRKIGDNVELLDEKIRVVIIVRTLKITFNYYELESIIQNNEKVSNAMQ